MGGWAGGRLAPLAAFLSEQGAVPAIQINHSGRKGSAQRAWEGNGVLTPENLANGDESCSPLGASATPFAEGWPTPLPLDRAGLDEIRDAFVATALRALRAGFRIIELHMAHGYLLQSFLSPIANKRTDEYGGSRENRMRFPLEVARAVRAALPAETPLFARISAVDWIEGGWEMDDSVALARELRLAGVDLVDCSSGGNLLRGATNSNLTRRPAYQAPFARGCGRKRASSARRWASSARRNWPRACCRRGGGHHRHRQADAVRSLLGAPRGDGRWAPPAPLKRGPGLYAWWLEKWSSGLKASGERPAA